MIIFVVIPTYNRKEALRACLESLALQTIRPVVFVGDSASTDGTAELLASAPLAVTRCPGTSDLWWTGATNLALRAALQRAAPDDWILCLNDDTIVKPNYLETILSVALQQGPRHIVGSVAVDIRYPDLIYDGGNHLNWITARFETFNFGRRLSEFPTDHHEFVNVLTGRGTLFPARVFHEVGLFNEKLVHYGADYEFAARCERAGHTLLIGYKAVVMSRTDLSGLKPPRNRFALREAYPYFFSRRSSGNLKDRLRFSWYVRINALTAVVFYLMSVLRIIKHYLVSSRRSDN